MTYRDAYGAELVRLDYLRPGEIDGRFVDFTPPLGRFGDTIPSLAVVNLTIARRDGQPMTSNDLARAGAAWPDTLDATRLIPTFGLAAPAGAAGVTYLWTVTIANTTQGRLEKAVGLINVAPF